MTTHKVYIGDVVCVVQGRGQMDTIMTVAQIDDDNGATRHVLTDNVPTCSACNSNDAYGDGDYDGMGQFCPTCINDATQVILIQKAVENLIENNEGIRRVFEVDDAEMRRAAREGLQYIDLDANAHDTIADYDAVDLAGNWVPRIAEQLRGMGATE